MASSSELSWTKEINSLQTSENFHPKFILALDILVDEKSVLFIVKRLERAISQQFQVIFFTCNQF